MRKLFSGGFGFLLCLLIGILLDQVALGIIAGMFLGGILAKFTPKPEESASDTQAPTEPRA